ncbi:MAG: hypothetical protein LBJ31_08115 [Treponema sp.]|nr:hypothetical protein [Treponema sp.]
MRYDGRSYIHNDQLKLFSEIIGFWLTFLRIAPKKLLINADNEIYDKHIVEKELKELELLINEARENDLLIMHWGV